MLFIADCYFNFPRLILFSDFSLFFLICGHPEGASLLDCDDDAVTGTNEADEAGLEDTGTTFLRIKGVLALCLTFCWRMAGEEPANVEKGKLRTVRFQIPSYFRSFLNWIRQERGRLT